MTPHTFDAIPPEDDTLFKLMAFLDGELAQDEEPELFAQLAVRQDLRTEFRELLNISTPFKSLEETPPKRSKKLVLAAVGLPLGAGSLSAGVLNGTSFGTVGAVFGGAVAAALLTAGSMFFLWSPSNEEPQASQLNSQPTIQQELKQETNAEAPGLTVNKSIAVDNQTSNYSATNESTASTNDHPEVLMEANLASANLNNTDYLASRMPQQLSSATAAFNTSVSKLPASQITQTDLSVDETINNFLDNAATKSGNELSMSQMTADNSSQVNMPTAAINTHAPLAILAANYIGSGEAHLGQSLGAEQDRTQLSKTTRISLPLDLTSELNSLAAMAELNDFYVVARRFHTISFPALEIDPLSDPLINNMALSFYFRIDTNHAIGFQLGQEHLLQEFNATQGGLGINYEQNFLALWYGVSYEYNFRPWEWLYGTRAYVNGVAAWNRTGPMIRSSAGLRIPLATSVNMRLSTEFSSALYIFSGSWFSTNKVGLSYGLDVGF